jgi:predicted acetyltransferase
MSDPGQMPLRIELVRAAAEQQSIVANLIELYAYDFSEFYPVEPGPDGRFGYRDLSRYWSEPDRLPFLVRVNDRWAGFALIRQDGAGEALEPVWDVVEFFVLRSCRRRSVGTFIAHELWQRYPGRWQVRVMESNEAGCRFWAKAVRTFAGDGLRMDGFEKGGANWRRFTFESKPGLSGPSARKSS